MEWCSANVRRVHRVVLDLMLTEPQAETLPELLEKALCAAPPDHEGPCRVAWSMLLLSEDDLDDEDEFVLRWTQEVVLNIRKDLEKIVVLSDSDLDAGGSNSDCI